MAQEQLGAPDERATAAMLRFVRDVPTGDARTSPSCTSRTPTRPTASTRRSRPSRRTRPTRSATSSAFHNHYRNSVRLQERTVAAFLRERARAAGWDDTAVVFLSDHGEQFREHGGLYHNHSLFDEELRVPGWLVARGPRARRRAARRAPAPLGAPAHVHAGRPRDARRPPRRRGRARDACRCAGLVTGRSLAPARRRGEPTALLATSTSGVGAGRRALRRHARRARAHRSSRAPGHASTRRATPASATRCPSPSCADLLEVVRERFPAAR